MAGFLGWFPTMSMAGTRGLLLASAIHFVQDVVIIASMIMMGDGKAERSGAIGGASL